jgi:unsaturated rhamnogalacturonyl hydrolase
MALLVRYFPDDESRKSEVKTLSCWPHDYQSRKTRFGLFVVPLFFTNYLEGTVSAMFVYSLLKAVNDGTLPADYLKPARAGYAGIVHDLIRLGEQGDVNLTQCCQVAGLGQPDRRDGSFESYISEAIVENDLKGVGPFIRAGIELDRLGGKKETFSKVPPASR